MKPHPKRLDIRKLYWGGEMSHTINKCIVTARMSTKGNQSAFWLDVDRDNAMHTPHGHRSRATE